MTGWVGCWSWWGAGQHFSSVQCSYSRQQRSPSQPAMRSACEVSACSVLTDINVPRGCALIQPSTARLGRQIRCVCASPAWLEAQQDPFLDRSSWRSVVASVARLMTGHRIAREFESLGEEWYHSNASPYATQRRKQKDEPDRQNAEIGSET